VRALWGPVHLPRIREHAPGSGSGRETRSGKNGAHDEPWIEARRATVYTRLPRMARGFAAGGESPPRIMDDVEGAGDVDPGVGAGGAVDEHRADVVRLEPLGPQLGEDQAGLGRWEDRVERGVCGSPVVGVVHVARPVVAHRGVAADHRVGPEAADQPGEVAPERLCQPAPHPRRRHRAPRGAAAAGGAGAGRGAVTVEDRPPRGPSVGSASSGPPRRPRPSSPGRSRRPGRPHRSDLRRGAPPPRLDTGRGASGRSIVGVMPLWPVWGGPRPGGTRCDTTPDRAFAVPTFSD